MDAQTPELQAVVERRCRKLAERLETVEGQCGALARQNRLLKIAGAMALVLVAGIFVLDAATPMPEHLDVKRLYVVGEYKPRGRWGVYQEKVSLRLFPNSGWVSGGISAYASPDGSTGLDLLDMQDRRRAGLSLNEEGSPTLAFYDADGNVIWQAPPPAE